jgi:hypothetical protein
MIVPLMFWTRSFTWRSFTTLDDGSTEVWIDVDLKVLKISGAIHF